ncbi:MAG: hypothetical protein R6W95_16930 [Desulfosarcina sp.]
MGNSRWRMVWVVVFAFVVLSCGGGGGGGSAPTTLTPATITPESLAQSAAMALITGDLTDLNQTLSPLSSSGYQPLKADLAARMIDIVMDEIFRQPHILKPAGSVSESDTCSNGGTISISASWVGPDDDPVDCSEVTNLNATMTFSSCTEGGLFADGTVRLRFTGNACEPTAIAMEFANLTLEESVENMQISMNTFKMDIAGMVWSLGEVTRMTATFNGDVSAILGDEAFDMQFSNYRYGVQPSGSGGAYVVTVDGSLTGSCLDGWVTVSTLEALVVPLSNGCPVSGKLGISGTGQGTVTFTSPGVQVDWDGQITDYPTCDDLPGC